MHGDKFIIARESSFIVVCRLVEIDYFFSGDRIVVGYINFEKRMMFDIGDDRNFLYTI